MTAGERIRLLRKERSLTREDLAAALAFSPNSVYAWEKRGISPSLISAARLADYFGVSLDYIAGRTDKRSPPG